MQTHADLVLGHNRHLRVVDLLGERHARLIHAERLAQQAIVFAHILQLVTAVEA